jgi:hypothetical protein
MKCKSAETRQRNQTNAELMLCTIIVQMKSILTLRHYTQVQTNNHIQQEAVCYT